MVTGGHGGYSFSSGVSVFYFDGTEGKKSSVTDEINRRTPSSR